jgi:hypothetical protein
VRQFSNETSHSRSVAEAERIELHRTTNTKMGVHRLL